MIKNLSSFIYKIRSLRRKSFLSSLKKAWHQIFFPIRNPKLTSEKLKKLISSLSKHKAKIVFMLDHTSPGGSTSYRIQKQKEILKDKNVVILCQYLYLPALYSVEIHVLGQEKLCFYTKKFEMILVFLEKIENCEVFVNNLAGWPNICSSLKEISKLKNAKIVFFVHDYYCLCPSYNLIDFSGNFCNLEPSKNACNRCLSLHKHLPISKSNIPDISEWRKSWVNFLNVADSVSSPSEYAKRLVHKKYPSQKIKVIPHETKYDWRKISNKITHDSKTLKIGVVGNITFPKGSKIVEEVARYIEAEDIDAEIIIIGQLDIEYKIKRVKIHGKYELKKLPTLVKKYNLDLALVPSIWPETFCYVVAEIIQLGLPLVTLPLGAQAEQAKKYNKGFISQSSSAEDILEACLKANLSHKVSP